MKLKNKQKNTLDRINKKGFTLSNELVYIIIGVLVLVLIFVWITNSSKDSCGLIANIFGKC